MQENIISQFPVILKNMEDQISLKNILLSAIIDHFKVLTRNYSLTVQTAKLLVSDVKHKLAGHHNFLFASIFYICC